MRTWIKYIDRQLEHYREDLEYLLYVGVPAGLLMVLFSGYMNFQHLF